MAVILILTAGFGEGHNAAARNIRDALISADPDARVALHDIFAETYGIFTTLSAKAYVALINHAPAVWNTAFQFFHATTFLQDGIWVFGRAARRLKNLIDELQPSVIVSTYPGNNHLLDHIYNKSPQRPYKQVTVITDSLTINSAWYHCHSDSLVVANEQTADVIRAAGVPAGKIKVLGFPVPLIFSSGQIRRDLPASGEKWRVLYMINSGRGIAPEITRQLLQVENISLIITVGRDAALGDSLRALATDVGKTVELHGWTKEMPRLLAQSHLLISKAGGATVQETLAAKTPMIITQVVPGQEEGNARLVADYGAGTIATTPPTIADAVRNAFANDAAIYRSWLTGIEKLHHPSASSDIARYLLQLAHEN